MNQPRRTRVSNDPDRLDWAKGDGLIPAVIQDVDDARVLMLGYMNRAALERTRESGRVTFFSRSRGKLWTKGETSGNFLALVSIACDCDADTLLIRARPAGPVCHLGTRTCFDALPDGAAATPGDASADAGPPPVSAGELHVLAELDALLAARRADAPEGSYVGRLFAAGTTRCAQKVGEEGVETALAGAAGEDDALVGEAADLIFHTMVLLRRRGLSLGAVLRELGARRRR